MRLDKRSVLHDELAAEQNVARFSQYGHPFKRGIVAVVQIGLPRDRMRHIRIEDHDVGVLFFSDVQGSFAGVFFYPVTAILCVSFTAEIIQAAAGSDCSPN